MIQVAYRLWGGDGFYAKMLGTSMLSMFENTKEKVTVHIMHNDRLTPDNRGKFCYIAGQYNQRVEFHNVEKIAGPTLRKFEAAYPIKSGINSSWYPLITHEVFPNLDKLIFLGADTVIHLDIAELWAYNLNEQGGGYGFAAVPDHIYVPREIIQKFPHSPSPLVEDHHVKYEDYFCADVFLLNPEFFRQNFEDILNACRFLHENGYDKAEQDALAYLFSTKYKKLPRKFNLAPFWARLMFLPIENVIYHFGGMKPDLNTDDIFNRLYWQYFLKTPWANADMFGNIDKVVKNIFNQTINDSRNILLNMTNLLTSRRRAFFVDKHNIDAIKQIFAVKNDELMIDATPLNADKILFDEMNKSRGEKILFIFIGNNYIPVAKILVEQNFVEGVDFINGEMFLSEHQGINANFITIPIAQAI